MKHFLMSPVRANYLVPDARSQLPFALELRKRKALPVQLVSRHLNLSPSPTELAEFLRLGELTKPVRVIPAKDTDGGIEYDLVEGRLRYWAWVLAFNGEKAVPAYVRYDGHE